MTPQTGSDDRNDCPRCGAPLESEGACPACVLRDAREPFGTDGLAGAGTEALAPEVVDARLDAYDVQVLLGRGGMGAVYRARHRKLDRMVAIKVLRPDAAGIVEDAAAFAERFEREARVLAKLDHPNIVRIHDYGQSGGDTPFFYLVLEYVEGATLRDLLSQGRLSAREALDLAPQICDALQAAHDVGVVHRDVKPENILVDAAGRVRIADFGLAKLRGADPTAMGITRTDQVFGTAHYMAPEQMRASGQVDHRADLFSLGVVLYEMLTGELPLGRFAPPSATAAEAARLDPVVLKALENDPDARYQAARELQRDVESAPTASPTAPVVTRPLARTASDDARESVRRGAQPIPPRISVEPGSRFGVIRTWSAAGLLALTYPMTWIQAREGRLYLPDEMFGLEDSSVSAAGYEGWTAFAIFDVPWWYALIGLFVAAVLRTFRAVGHRIPELWPWLMTSFGLYVVAITFGAAWVSPGVRVRGGLALALLILLLSSMVDVAASFERRDAVQAARLPRPKSRRRRHALARRRAVERVPNRPS
ncbi:MAG: protein kinase [Planctomycetota bacterium]